MANLGDNFYILAMRRTLPLLVLLIISNPLKAKSNKVIYGEDNRREPFEVANSRLEYASNSVAAIISNYSLRKIGHQTELVSLTLDETINYCPSVPYTDQISAASCTSFLVAPDIVLTAGHCIKTDWDCQTKSFVFDYRIDKIGTRVGPYKRFRIDNDNIYKCAEILERKLEKEGTLEDWAIIKLDRRVEDREPLAIRTSGRMQSDVKLSLLGFPSGIPLKIATDGKLRNDENKYFFVAEVDAFHMNSGSPVINEATLEVEGLLVRGEKDFINRVGCYDLMRCNDGSCRGEDVSRITSIPLDKYLD
ncbi:trypsin-like serine peptidase [Halobacteriovorax marinus]|uniref:trypsin-like serine peptidase n=1 Tax=Halobacteriovorax marinus TaxID=97084 RepID=UPI003A90395B